jgi:hypothetical protein
LAFMVSDRGSIEKNAPLALGQLRSSGVLPIGPLATPEVTE